MNQVQKRQPRPEKETIHSGHFMVSHFEAEAQDDFDDLVSVPDEEQNVQKVSVVATYTVPGIQKPFPPTDRDQSKQHQQLSIEVSLTKLFRCMTLAYRQKLTSPKWNRFKGIKLRWKDKIRLNNVIWRCWHMQFIKKQNTLVCQFASPLDVDTHVKPETTILEGKYWKRRAEAVIAEYKKWRKFHIMRLLGKGDTSAQDTVSDMDMVESFSQCSDLAGNMLEDEDYLNFMTDTLFSTITNHQPFAFPDCREIARGASLADFIQPSLGPLQPNLDDFMDTLEPLQDLLLTPRLAPVPEEPSLPAEEPMYRTNMPVEAYPAQGYLPTTQTATNTTMQNSQIIHGSSNTQLMTMGEQTIKNEHMRMYDNGRIYAPTDMTANMSTNMATNMSTNMSGNISTNMPANMSTNMSTNMSSSMATNMLPSQELVQYSPVSYETQADHHMQEVYGGKNARLQYVSAPKIVTHPDSLGYNKYNTGVPPSQTAPETVSLLQASGKLARAPQYARDKRRNHYGTHHANNIHYTQTSERPAAPQYIPPAHEPYKAKPAPPAINARSFKMPSPPAPSTQLVSPSGNSPVGAGAGRSKEQYRSHSLPLGSQLNADWTVTTPSAAPPPPPASMHDVAKHNARTREMGRSTSSRLRSRSTSGGAEGAPRRPPPLTSVASEPTLPQASVMLAHLLSAQHSQSLYKLNSTEDASAADGQPSPIGSDVMSPHHSLSPPPSPGSPPSGSPREARRTHLHAEQKRRYNIKNGFDTLQALIPHLNSNPAAKISKAAMLQKGAEYIKQLKAERNQMKEEMESLRQQIESLNNSISNCHSLLPATGAPVSRARAGRLREMFARHVANRTMHNWKYWLFSVVSAALVESFSACVSSGSGADLVRTTLLWAEQHCSLVEMRPAVLNSLRLLCTTTDILTNPERLPEEARASVAASAAVKNEPT